MRMIEFSTDAGTKQLDLWEQFWVDVNILQVSPTKIWNRKAKTWNLFCSLSWTAGPCPTVFMDGCQGERWRWRGGNCIAAGVLVSFCPGCSWICHEESWRLTLVGHREHDCWVVLQCFGLLYSNSVAWICVQNTYYTEMHFIAKSLAPSRCLRIKTTMPNMGRGHTWSPWWLQILTRNQFSSTKSR